MSPTPSRPTSFVLPIGVNLPGVVPTSWIVDRRSSCRLGLPPMEPMTRPGVAQSTTCLERQVTRDRLIMLRASVGSTRVRAREKLDPFLPVPHQILKDDKADALLASVG